MKTDILSIGLAVTVVFAASFAQAFAGTTTLSGEGYGSSVYAPYAGSVNSTIFEGNGY